MRHSNKPTMSIRSFGLNLGKLLVCGGVFSVGIVLGGMIASMLGLKQPTLPAGVDASAAPLYMMLTTPLIAFALALVARGLGGSLVTRAAILASFAWITYTVNTQLEASIFSTYAQGLPFALVTYLVPCVLCGAAVAWLFPSEHKGESLAASIRSFFARRPSPAWGWRLPIAVVAFMPIYFLFGLMVVPFTSEYYRQSMFGLSMPTIDQILPILFVRSVLFLVACLPIVIMWQKTDRSLFWRLGLALFILVGFIYMLISTWLPLYVRFPHTLEILADEFVYAGALVLLLGQGRTVTHETPTAIRLPRVAHG